MDKFEVHISFFIAAETRHKAYGIVKQLIHKHMQDYGSIEFVSYDPIPDPDKWIALNEPIKAKVGKIK